MHSQAERGKSLGVSVYMYKRVIRAAAYVYCILCKKSMRERLVGVREIRGIKMPDNTSRPPFCI